MLAIVLATGFLAGLALPVAAQTEPAPLPYVDEALDSYEAALVAGLDALRSGGRERLIADAEACSATFAATPPTPPRVQYCYLYGDAVGEILRRTGDMDPVPSELSEPVRRTAALAALATEAFDAETAGWAISAWSALGRQAVTFHLDDLAAIKASRDAPPASSR